MNSESGKERAGGSVFFAPFTVLKILGCGVFGRTAFSRSEAPIAAVDVGDVLCREMKAPFWQPSGPFLCDPECPASLQANPSEEAARTPLTERERNARSSVNNRAKRVIAS